MSDYELIMIILTFLTLLIAVDSKNRRYVRTTVQPLTVRWLYPLFHCDRSPCNPATYLSTLYAIRPRLSSQMRAVLFYTSFFSIHCVQTSGQ